MTESPLVIQLPALCGKRASAFQPRIHENATLAEVFRKLDHGLKPA
jgi:hypothetical protein